MGGGLEIRCVGRVYGADGAVHLAASSWHSLYSMKVETNHFISQRTSNPTNSQRRR